MNKKLQSWEKDEKSEPLASLGLYYKFNPDLFLKMLAKSIQIEIKEIPTYDKHILALYHGKGKSFYSKIGSKGEGKVQFNSPCGLAVDKQGHIFIIDNNNRIQQLAPDGSFIRMIGSKGAGNGEFNGPYGIAIDPVSGNILVADRYNNRIQVFDSNGNFVSCINKTDKGIINQPVSIAVHPSGNLAILEIGLNRVQIISPSGSFIKTFGTSGKGDGQLSSPLGLAVDNEGNYYVTDFSNNRVQIFRSDGTFLSKRDGFTGPWGITVDSQGTYIVCENTAHRVSVVHKDGTVNHIGTSGTGSGQFSHPTGIAINPAGRLIVSEYGNCRLQVFD